MDLLLPFVVAMVVTAALIPPLMRVAGRLHVLDAPESRKVHMLPMPRVGGIAMIAGSLLSLYLWLPLDSTLLAYLLAALVLLGFGVWDDRVNLSPSIKLAGQLLAALIVIWAGHVSIDSLTFGSRVTLPGWLGFSLTLLFLLGITNAINLSDGLDGLAGGTTLLCCAALTLLGENWEVRLVENAGAALMGAIVGFLRFNTYPARVFMGDAGSQFLGFSVGVLCILATQQSATPVSTALPLLLAGLPILDTLTVMVRRVAAGRSPFAGDRQHFHHRLLALGFDHYEAVVLIYAVQALLLLLAWFMRFENDLLIVATFVAFAASFSGGLVLLERSGWRWHAAPKPSGTAPVGRVRNWPVIRAGLQTWSLRLACGCTAGYFAGVALYAHPVAADIGALALGCLALLALGSRWRRSPFAASWLLPGALYIAVMVAVYLDYRVPGGVPELQAIKWVVLPPLVIAVVLAVRLWGDRRFQATPFDLLLVFAALALPNLPGLENAPHNIGLTVVKLVALCYAVEMIASVGSRLRLALVGASALFFLVVAARALA